MTSHIIYKIRSNRSAHAIMLAV